MSKIEKRKIDSGGGPVFTGNVINNGSISGRSDNHAPTPKQVSRSPEAKNRGLQNNGQVFVSYRRSDSIDITGRIYDSLVDRFGKASIFKDVDSIPLGIDFKDYLEQMVGSCHVLLAIIGREWAEARDAKGKRRLDDPADFVRIEVASALTRRIPVIPLLVQGAQMPMEASLSADLRTLVYRNGIQIRPDPDFHRDMDRLISALENYI
jgi:hypothetical protein